MIKTSSSTRSTYIYIPLWAFYQLECNIVLLYAMFLRSKTSLAGHDHLITPNTEFLMGHYGLPFSGSDSVSANRWNRVLSGHRLYRQNISTDPPPSIYILSAKWEKKGIKARCCHIRARSWPLTSLCSGCETDGAFQKPSIYFRVRPKLISTALKGSADIIDKTERHSNLTVLLYAIRLVCTALLSQSYLNVLW